MEQPAQLLGPQPVAASRFRPMMAVMDLRGTSIMLSVTLIMTMTVSMGVSVYAETAAGSSGAGETASAERNAGDVSDKPFAVNIPKGLSIISERVGKAVDPIDLSQYVSGPDEIDAEESIWA